LRGVANVRLAIEVSKAQNDIPTAKRDGVDMTGDVRSSIQLDEHTSSRRATTTLRQEVLLNELEEALEKDEETVVAKFEKLRAECKAYFPTAFSNVSNEERETTNQCHRRCIELGASCLGMGQLHPRPEIL
jgi:Zn-dependent M16 (insulinase) family peptidase